ncbi:MAG: ATP-binding protein, partial [Prevotellaceae bacterium]|nr:ATP-binding protein [Prevotellaceae bacterium]
MSRNAKCIIVSGARGTGKTTLIEELLKTYQSNVVVCTPHIYEWQALNDTDLKQVSDFQFSGAQRHIIRPQYTLERLKFLVNGAVVFDDCK